MRQAWGPRLPDPRCVWPGWKAPDDLQGQDFFRQGALDPRELAALERYLPGDGTAEAASPAR